MNPTGLFLIIFVGAPLLELYVLIEVGSQIGASWTILLSILTAALGGWLVRTQGFSVAFRAQQQMQQGTLPALELMEGTTLLIVGFALLLPGFITDVIGFLLLIPTIRRHAILRILQQRGILRPGTTRAQASQQSHYIEGEFRREDTRP